MASQNVIVIIGIFSLMGITAQGCSQVKVSGAIFQKGIEGKYELHDICQYTGNSDMYIQTEPAAGWGSVFYLYHYYRPDEHGWKGWVFSMYPCSDIAFARSASDASSPDQVETPWEEFLIDDFHVNPDILVKCHRGSGLHYLGIVIVTTISLISLVIIVIIPIIILRRMKSTSQRERESFDEMNTNSSVQEMDDAVYIPQPPIYEEVTSASNLPPSYSDIKSSQEQLGNRSSYTNMAEITSPPPVYRTSTENLLSNTNRDINTLQHQLGGSAGTIHVSDDFRDTDFSPNYIFPDPIITSGQEPYDAYRNRLPLQSVTNIENENNGYNAVNGQLYIQQQNNHADRLTAHLPPSYEAVINDNNISNT